MANPVKCPATVVELTDHEDDVYTVVMRPGKRLPGFKPGQFLHLALDDFDEYGGLWPDSRVFSIASGPADSHISIAYSVKGRFTGRMSRELAPGKNVWLKLPYGHFIIHRTVPATRDIVLVAGGTGISPFLSFLADDCSRPAGRHTHLLYGIRKPSHLLFQDLLCSSLDTNDFFSMDLFIERPDGRELLQGNTSVVTGKISLEHIARAASRLNNPAFFLSGPPSMISAFRNGLLNARVPSDDILIDDWE